MQITEKTDPEIIAITSPMIDDVIQASNHKDWPKFCQYQTEEEANDPSNKHNVEKQWEESRFLTSLRLDREIIGVQRRGDIAVVYWTQTSIDVQGEYLASYHVKQYDQIVKEVGFLIV